MHEGRLGTARVVQKFAHAPAQLFDVAERGFLREGNFADLVLVDDTLFTVRREDVLSKMRVVAVRRHRPSIRASPRRG